MIGGHETSATLCVVKTLDCICAVNTILAVPPCIGVNVPPMKGLFSVSTQISWPLTLSVAISTGG